MRLAEPTAHEDRQERTKSGRKGKSRSSERNTSVEPMAEAKTPPKGGLLWASA
jgi:hypothetical protein